ncbi:hypothetical protein D3C76_1711610 [compost metagenome]
MLRFDPQLFTVAKLHFFDIEQTVNAVIKRQPGRRSRVVHRETAVRIAVKQIVTAKIPIDSHIRF